MARGTLHVALTTHLRGTNAWAEYRLGKFIDDQLFPLRWEYSEYKPERGISRSKPRRHGVDKTACVSGKKCGLLDRPTALNQGKKPVDWKAEHIK
jgi:hypothetical protein